MNDFVLISGGLVTAAAFGFVARLLKLPALIGFLAAGILLGNITAHFSQNLSLFSTLSQLGITLLLFLVGLEMDLKQLAHFSKTIILVSLFQITFSFLLVAGISLTLGFSSLESLFIGLALSFSSTIIAVKILSERQDLSSLHGKITIGILLVQDLVAITALILLNRPDQSFSFASILIVFIKAILLFGFTWLVSKKPLPFIFDRLANHPELLYVASLAWAFGLSALVSLPFIGFSIEIGGFLAGLSLASTSEHLQIASRIRPVRDLFLTLFFLSLGMHMQFNQFSTLLLPAIILSVIVLVGKTFLIASSMGFLGFRRRTAFLTGINLSQISEFSFIVIGIAASFRYADQSLVALIVLVGAITMIISAYLATNSNHIYIKIRFYLKFLEKDKTHESVWRPETFPENHTLLFGCDRVGRSLLPVLKDKTRPLLVVDANPKIVSQLIADGIPAAYGDTSDLELLEEINLEKSHMIISTVPDPQDNLLVLEKIKNLSPKPITIVVAEQPRQALRLYEAGADYVLIPRLLTGAYLARLLTSHEGRTYFAALREKQLNQLSQLQYIL